MRRLTSIILSVLILFTVFSPLPQISAFSKIVVFAEKTDYVAGESVYIFGQLGDPFDISEPVSIIVSSPSGGSWSSIDVQPDSAGKYGATIGIISLRDSTGTYVVSVRYFAFANQTTFQVRTPQMIDVKSDKEVYLLDESISFTGVVSPVNPGYQVTLRLGPDGPNQDWVAVGQTKPLSDGSFTFNNFYKVHSEDNGIWIVNATYGPFGSQTQIIYVGVKVTLNSAQSEYIPGQMLNIEGTVSPVSPGSIDLVIRTPTGGIFYRSTVSLDGAGGFSVVQLVYPGDEVGIYTVSANFLGVINTTSFVMGRLDSSVMGISDFDIEGSRWLRADSMVRVSATLTNLDIVAHDVVFIIQIKDSSGKIMHLGGQPATIDPDSLIGQTVGTLSLSEKGRYTVQAFAWDSWENANVLAEIQTIILTIW